MTPKQIINKIFYSQIIYNFLLNRKFVNHDSLLKKINSILKLNRNKLFLGKARTGIYLAVKQFLNKEKPKSFNVPFYNTRCN